jgi:Uma2 family endonuclease
MGTITKLSFEEYQQLPEPEGPRYELDEGVLVMLPSPTWWHNCIRDRIARRLQDFVSSTRLGYVTVKTEFRLAVNTARTPDVAFVTRETYKKIDIHRSPVDGAPDLAIEVLSQSNRNEDMAKKTRQYFVAGCRSVWIIDPELACAEIHSHAGVQTFSDQDELKDESLLPGFFLALPFIFAAEE